MLWMLISAPFFARSGGGSALPGSPASTALRRLYASSVLLGSGGTLAGVAAMSLPCQGRPLPALAVAAARVLPARALAATRATSECHPASHDRPTRDPASRPVRGARPRTPDALTHLVRARAALNLERRRRWRVRAEVESRPQARRSGRCARSARPPRNRGCSFGPLWVVAGADAGRARRAREVRCGVARPDEVCMGLRSCAKP